MPLILRDLRYAQRACRCRREGGDDGGGGGGGGDDDDDDDDDGDDDGDDHHHDNNHDDDDDDDGDGCDSVPVCLCACMSASESLVFVSSEKEGRAPRMQLMTRNPQDLERAVLVKMHTFAPPTGTARHCCMLRGTYQPSSLFLSSAISPWLMSFTMGIESRAVLRVTSRHAQAHGLLQGQGFSRHRQAYLVRTR